METQLLGWLIKLLDPGLLQKIRQFIFIVEQFENHLWSLTIDTYGFVCIFRYLQWSPG